MKATALLTVFMHLYALLFCQTFDAQISKAAASLRKLRGIAANLKTTPLTEDDVRILRSDMNIEAAALNQYINSGENVQIRLAYYYKTLIPYEVAVIESLSNAQEQALKDLKELADNFTYLAKKEVYPIEYSNVQFTYQIEYSTILPVLKAYHKRYAALAFNSKNWDEAEKGYASFYKYSEGDNEDRYHASHSLITVKIKKGEFDRWLFDYFIDNIQTLLSMSETEIQDVRNKGLYDIEARLGQLDLILEDHGATMDEKNLAVLGFIFSDKKYNRRMEASEYYTRAIAAGYKSKEMMPTILSLAAEVNNIEGIAIAMPLIDSMISEEEPGRKASSYEQAGNYLREFKHYSQAFYFYKKALEAGYSSPAGFLEILETTRYLKNNELNEMIKGKAKQELGNENMKLEIMSVWTEVGIKLQDSKLADAYVEKMGKAMDKMKLEELCPHASLMQMSFSHWGYLNMADKWASVSKKCIRKKL